MCWSGCDTCPNGWVCSIAFWLPFAFGRGTALVGIIYRTFGEVLAFGGDICLAFVPFAPTFGLTLAHLLAFMPMTSAFPFRCGRVSEISPRSLRWRREALALVQCSGSNCPRLLSKKAWQGSA